MQVFRSLSRTILVALALAVSSAPLAAQPNPLAVEPGKLSLDLADGPVSSLGVDRQGLGDALCSSDPFPSWPGDDRGGGSEDCRLVVGGNGSNSRSRVLEVGIGALLPRTDGAVVTVVPEHLHLEGEDPFPTPCGLWQFRVALDRRVVQPKTRLVLEPAAPGAATSLFVGTLRLAVAVRFESLDDGTVRTLWTALELDTAGRWTALAPTGLEPGASNLALFVDRQGAFVDRPGCAQDREVCGRLCLTAAPATVELANEP
jgi:hypothetical protein